MASSGIQTASQSAGDASPRAGTIRPDKVAALSYCYELMGDWEKAAEAWRDFVGIMKKRSESDERSLYLDAKRSAESRPQ